jgi:hypothetical protein
MCAAVVYNKDFLHTSQGNVHIIRNARRGKGVSDLLRFIVKYRDLCDFVTKEEVGSEILENRVTPTHF